MRYKRAAADELLHFDIQKFGGIDGAGHRITGDRTKNHNRGIGWDLAQLAIDDHSRALFAQILSDEKAVSCAQFLRAAVAYYASPDAYAPRSTARPSASCRPAYVSWPMPGSQLQPNARPRCSPSASVQPRHLEPSIAA